MSVIEVPLRTALLVATRSAAWASPADLVTALHTPTMIARPARIASSRRGHRTWQVHSRKPMPQNASRTRRAARWRATGSWSRASSCGSRDDGAMTTYSGTDEFEGAAFVRASLKGATFRFSDVSGVTMRSVDVGGLDIDSHDLAFGSLFVNGVDVVPLVEAELNRQFPGRELKDAQTPEGLREGWLAVQTAWQETVASTPPNLVDAHVEDEWSLAQTLRHLVLATDAWLRGGIQRVPQPFHEIGQI